MRRRGADACIGEVEIANQQAGLAVAARQLRRTVRHVLRREGVRGATVSVAVVDDGAMRRLERQWVGKGRATDVLSFDLGGEKSGSAASGGGRNKRGGSRVGAAGRRRVDCEIVVNGERAARVSRRGGWAAAGELHLYLVHGLLHQLGFDDRTASEAREMHQREDHLLEELGFGRVYAAAGARGSAP